MDRRHDPRTLLLMEVPLQPHVLSLMAHRAQPTLREGPNAFKDRGAGYCVFNDLAVCASHALHQGVSRVLIVDLDVHQGWHRTFQAS